MEVGVWGAVFCLVGIFGVWFGFVVGFFFIIIICLFLNFSFLFSKLKFGVLVGEVIA